MQAGLHDEANLFQQNHIPATVEDGLAIDKYSLSSWCRRRQLLHAMGQRSASENCEGMCDTCHHSRRAQFWDLTNEAICVLRLVDPKFGLCTVKSLAEKKWRQISEAGELTLNGNRPLDTVAKVQHLIAFMQVCGLLRTMKGRRWPGGPSDKTIEWANIKEAHRYGDLLRDGKITVSVDLSIHRTYEVDW
ncbi:hypothetical protein DL93DRAFT_2075781 [Clavulina sp. PMI_390]|nr:hypothetical protein DL93DRAFT_2075781 [Clavulina sp. PMI_390]